MTYKTFIKMKTKNKIIDFSMGTRDLLNQVIGIMGLKTMTHYHIIDKWGRWSNHNTFKSNGRIAENIL